MADPNIAKETIFDDPFRRGLPADQVPALLASLGFSDFHAADVKPCDGGLSNSICGWQVYHQSEHFQPFSIQGTYQINY